MHHPVVTEHTSPFTIEHCESGGHGCYGELLVVSKARMFDGREYGEIIYFPSLGDAEQAAFTISRDTKINATIVALATRGDMFIMN